MLRAMRAAEMALWEAARPAAAPKAEVTIGRSRATRPFPQSSHRAGVETWLFSILAGCAIGSLFLGLKDISSLLTGWSHFADGIRYLLL
jgi:hypothetical protein